MILHRPNRFFDGSSYKVNIQRGGYWSPHFHNSFEVFYVLEGEIECVVNNKSEIIRKGEFSMCLPNEIHSGHCIGDAEFWVCIFSKDLVHSFSKQISGKEGDRLRFTCSEALKGYLEEVFINTDMQDLLLQKACLYAICREYLQCVRLTERSGTKSETMNVIVDYIAENYTKNIKLSDLAAMLNYDYHYVSRLFRSLFNMPFSNFLNIYRLERAAELLQNDNKKLVDVAYESGFQSVRTFNDSFKAYYGISPTEYKKTSG